MMLENEIYEAIIGYCEEVLTEVQRRTFEGPITSPFYVDAHARLMAQKIASLIKDKMLVKVEHIIDENRLPEPFRTYWTGKSEVEPNKNHPYKFYLVGNKDPELYVQEFEETEEGENFLLIHWTMLSCSTLARYMRLIGVQREDGRYLIRPNGEKLFYTAHRDESFATIAVSSLDGEEFIIHQN